MRYKNTIHSFETNKNAVIFWFGPGNEKPCGCVCRYLGFNIATNIYDSKDHKFSVYDVNHTFIRFFSCLRDAKNFIKSQYNKTLDLFV